MLHINSKNSGHSNLEVERLTGYAIALIRESDLDSRRTRLQEAELLLGQAESLEPGNDLCRLNRAVVLQQLGRATEALSLAEQPVSDPSYQAEAAALIGSSRVELGDLEGAEQAFLQALNLNPLHRDACCNYGELLHRLGRNEESQPLLELAANEYPAHTPTLINLALVLREQNQLAESEARLRRTIELDPDNSVAWLNLGTVLYDQLRLEESISAYRRSLELDPHNDQTRYSLGMTLLLAGESKEGWEKCEARTGAAARQWLDAQLPRWDGAPIKGRLLLYAEQGLGDTMHFVRWCAAARARSTNVRLVCQPGLGELLRASNLADEIIEQPLDSPKPLEGCEAQLSLLSLPHAVGGDEFNEAASPYLVAPQERVDLWRRRLPGGSAPRIGLIWAGNPKHQNDRRRTISPELFKPFSAVQNCRFISLQVGGGSEDLNQLSQFMNIFPYGERLRDLADTAAIMTHLDLIISADTSTAHLAGSLGVPAWVLLPYSPDWRWGLEQEYTALYPLVRLFRQPEPGMWEPVLQSIADALEAHFPTQKS